VNNLAMMCPRVSKQLCPVNKWEFQDYNQVVMDCSSLNLATSGLMENLENKLVMMENI